MKFKVAQIVLLIFCFSVLSIAQEMKFEGSFAKKGVEPSSIEEEDLQIIHLPGGDITVGRNTYVSSSDTEELVLIQLSSEPSETLLKQYSDDGICLYDFVGSGAYWAIVPPGKNPVKDATVRAVIKPDPSLKIISILKEATEDLKGSDLLEVRIGLLEGTTPAMLKRELDITGLNVRSEKFLFGDAAVVTIPLKYLKKLAACKLVISVEPAEVEKTTHNLGASQVVGSTAARNVYGLNGSVVRLGIWDGGAVYRHRDLGNRVTLIQNSGISDHATHVSGTMAAWGSNASARGMAPSARIWSWDYDGDVPTEMKNAINNLSLYLCNNSWGYVLGWEYGRYKYNNEYIWSWHGKGFGEYWTLSKQLDKLIFKKSMIIVFSAGNDRNDEIIANRYYNTFTKKMVFKFVWDQDGPYSSVGPTGVSKNVITVGATNDYKQMADFSCWGPTNSGMLKPEICAPGVDIFSTLPNNRYGKMSGTSMAAPVVTGSIALLMDFYYSITGYLPTPDLVRCLIAVTATDLGMPGPDYSYGFGMLNTAAAADLLSASRNSSIIDLSSVKKGFYNQYKLTVSSNSKMKVCLAWIDPQGNGLVNNLDLRVVDPNGKVYQPYKLKPNKPNKRAKTGDNNYDNIELIEIYNPTKGSNWKIQVIADRIGKKKKQNYALIIW